MTGEITGDEWAPGVPDESAAQPAQTSGSADVRPGDVPQPADGGGVGQGSRPAPGSRTPADRPVHAPSPADRYPVTDPPAPAADRPRKQGDAPDPFHDGAGPESLPVPDADGHAESSPSPVHADMDSERGVNDELASGIERLEKRIESLHEDRSTLESMIRGLQSRNEELQGDLVMRALTPIVKELAILQGQARRIAKEAADRFEPSVASDVAFDFDDFAERIGETMDSLGVEAMGVTEGDPFDRRRHQASGRVPTSDESLDKCVASVVHEGYWASGTEKPVVYAKVRVHQYQASETTGTEVSDPERGTPTTATDGPEPITPAAEDPRTQQDDKENEQ